MCYILVRRIQHCFGSFEEFVVFFLFHLKYSFHEQEKRRLVLICCLDGRSNFR